MGFPRREHLSRLPFASAGDLPDSGTEPASPALIGRILYHWACSEAHNLTYCWVNLAARGKEGQLRWKLDCVNISMFPLIPPWCCAMHGVCLLGHQGVRTGSKANCILMVMSNSWCTQSQDGVLPEDLVLFPSLKVSETKAENPKQQGE